MPTTKSILTQAMPLAIKVHNSTGLSIVASQLLGMDGFDPNSGRVTVKLADIGAAPPLLADFIAVDPIADGADGDVYQEAVITGVNTLAAAVGDAVYLDSSVPGGWTLPVAAGRKPPASSTPDQVVGRVLVSDQVAGEIMINLSLASWVASATAAPVALARGSDGLGSKQTARATFDASLPENQGVGTHELADTIPANAIIVGGFADIKDAFRSAGDNAGTVGLSIQGANDLISSAPVSGAPFSTTGLKAIKPKANSPETTGIKLSEPQRLKAIVAGHKLHSGLMTVFLDYVISQ